MFGIGLSTADGSKDDATLLGMELGADNGTSDGALLVLLMVLMVLMALPVLLMVA